MSATFEDQRAIKEPHDDECVSVSRYFGLVFLLSSPLYLLAILAGLRILGPPELGGLYIMLVTGIPVCAASILVTQQARTDNDETANIQRRKLFRKSLHFDKSKVSWYVLAMVVGPCLTAVSKGIVMKLKEDDTPLPEAAIPLHPVIIPIAFLVFFIMAIGEEVGWMGCSFESLRHSQNDNALQASIMLGLVWSLWHLPFFFFLFPPPLLHTIPLQLITIIANRIFMVWLYQNSGKSVLAVILYHAADNVALVVFSDLKAVVPEIPCVLTVLLALVIVLLYDSQTLTKCRLKMRRPKTA